MRPEKYYLRADPKHNIQKNITCAWTPNTTNARGMPKHLSRPPSLPASIVSAFSTPFGQLLQQKAEPQLSLSQKLALTWMKSIHVEWLFSLKRMPRYKQKPE